MWSFDEDGRATVTKNTPRPADPELDPRPSVFFDDEANWILIRGLLENPIAQIQYIFVADWLKQRIIDHAVTSGEPEELVQLAGYLLHQPGDALPHDDHFHVRIYCAPADLAFGCDDFGQLRWLKKEYKYRRKSLSAPMASELTDLVERAFVEYSVGGLAALVGVMRPGV
jgi:penicillin-insensitive murein endopeptidase